MLKFFEWIKDKDTIRLYRGINKEFDVNYDLSKTDAPHGYSTWTNNPELAKQYGSLIYYIDLPKSQLRNEYIDENGERALFYTTGKPAGLNNISGDEYLLYTGHELYDPSQIKLRSSNVEI